MTILGGTTGANIVARRRNKEKLLIIEEKIVTLL
jgi:hypothetical protein